MEPWVVPQGTLFLKFIFWTPTPSLIHWPMQLVFGAETRDVPVGPMHIFKPCAAPGA